MGNNLDIRRYIQLLQKITSLEKQEKSLLKENKAEYLEFLSYGAAVQKQISYNRKDEYISLIKEYLAERIKPCIFISKFLDMEREDGEAEEILTNDFKQLSTFSIDSKSTEFSSLLNKIFNNCMLAFELGPEDGISEDEFRDSIKNIFFPNRKFS